MDHTEDVRTQQFGPHHWKNGMGRSWGGELVAPEVGYPAES